MHPYAEQYLEFLQSKRRTGSILKVIRHDFAHFIIWCESQRRSTFDPLLFPHEDPRDWRVFRQCNDGSAPATIDRGLASLSGYCRWATSCELLPKNPATEVEDVTSELLAPR